MHKVPPVTLHQPPTNQCQKFSNDDSIIFFFF
jgi:hypothetical protein